MPVGMLGTAESGDVLDHNVFRPDLDRVVTALTLVELLRDRANDPDFVAICGETGQALTAVWKATK